MPLTRGPLRRGCIVWLYHWPSCGRFLILAYAKLSDRVGRQTIMIFRYIASIVLMYPMFELLKADGGFSHSLSFVVFCIE